jgi:hypothetical protein
METEENGGGFAWGLMFLSQGPVFHIVYLFFRTSTTTFYREPMKRLTLGFSIGNFSFAAETNRWTHFKELS